MTSKISKDYLIKSHIVCVFLLCLLFLFSMSYASAKTPLEFNIIPNVKENSVIDTKAQKSLTFTVIDDQETIFFNDKAIDIKDNTFSIDISKLSGKAEVKLSNGDNDTISFKYYFSDKTGFIKDYELLAGKNLKPYVTTVKNVKIIYSDKEKNTISKLKAYLNKAPNELLTNLSEIKMIPYSNTSNIAGTTKNNTITLYNFSKYTANTQKNIIYHEVTHTWANKLIDKKLIDYSYTKYSEIVDKDGGFVSVYAKDFAKDNNGKLSEDFADSTAFYIINPSAFRKNYPNRTSYIKELLKKEI